MLFQSCWVGTNFLFQIKCCVFNLGVLFFGLVGCFEVCSLPDLNLKQQFQVVKSVLLHFILIQQRSYLCLTEGCFRELSLPHLCCQAIEEPSGCFWRKTMQKNRGTRDFVLIKHRIVKPWKVSSTICKSTLHKMTSQVAQCSVGQALAPYKPEKVVRRTPLSTP